MNTLLYFLFAIAYISCVSATPVSHVDLHGAEPFIYQPRKLMRNLMRDLDSRNVARRGERKTLANGLLYRCFILRDPLSH